MLLRFDPVRELDRLHRQLLEDWTPRPAVPVDAYRRGDDLVVEIDLPGVDPASIDVTVDHHVLTVSATREWAPAEGDQVITRQRPHGSFRRQVTLGEAYDAERLEARYDLGVLTIRVPVADAARPRRIEVQTTVHPAVEAASTERSPEGAGEGRTQAA